jgi:hypothetical protein
MKKHVGFSSEQNCISLQTLMSDKDRDPSTKQLFWNLLLKLVNSQIKSEPSKMTSCTVFGVPLGRRNWFHVFANFLLKKRISEREIAE